MVTIVRNFIEFIETANTLEENEKLFQLENKLIDLLQFCNTIESDQQGKTLKNNLIYYKIRETISTNFPTLDTYNDTLEIIDNVGETELVTGNSIDDLTDIVLDLKESLLFPHEKDIKAHIKLSYQLHFQNHIINLLRYLTSGV